MLNKPSIMILGFINQEMSTPYNLVKLFKRTGFINVVGESTIYNYLVKLKDLGLIKIKAGSNKTTYEITKKGIISEDDAMQLLLNNTIEEDECFSAIYNLSKKTLKIAFQPYTNDIKTFSFEE